MYTLENYIFYENFLMSILFMNMIFSETLWLSVHKQWLYMKKDPNYIFWLSEWVQHICIHRTLLVSHTAWWL